jgi:hypothetical protein
MSLTKKIKRTVKSVTVFAMQKTRPFCPPLILALGF